MANGFDKLYHVRSRRGDAGVMVLEELARKIRARREKLGLKQQDLANALRVSPQAVSKWERGENAPDIALMAPLATLLGVSTDWLLATPGAQPDLLEATVFVSSVQGAYRKSRSLSAREFATWANGLFYTVTELTLRSGGVPIKYMGDQYLCFFSGPSHARRALQAAERCLVTLAEELRIGLAGGVVYVGAMGHPDYSHPDITGEAVNVTFLVHRWAEEHARGGLAATLDVVEQADALDQVVHREDVRFRQTTSPVTVCEVRPASRQPTRQDVK